MAETESSQCSHILVAVLVVVVGGVALAFPSNLYALHRPSYNDAPKPYNYAYDVNDRYAGTDFGHSEDSDGKTVKGSYNVQLPDGRKQTVNYMADHYNGYQADVNYYGEAQFPHQYGSAVTYKPQALLAAALVGGAVSLPSDLYKTPKHQQVYEEAASPKHQQVYEEAASPRYQPIYEEAASPAHQQVYEEATSPKHQPIYEESASPRYQQVYEESASPKYRQIYEEASSPEYQVYKEEPVPYNYAYGVRDEYAGTDFGHNEISDGATVTGSYTVQLPDGRKQTVTYVADHYNGYQAKVTYEGEAQYPHEYGPPITFKPQPYNPQPTYKPQPAYEPLRPYQ
ncbi:adhesive plaque matrix protein-like [Penaeus japonicus]|uniref:adhesive plaque matrix protein-like n=1 Tax=Penaeus japonicus TaxID=27405 RepID=UPI001C70CE04|nr:adhesive plaque matrix protein-like [Penaeus japonicus]